MAETCREQIVAAVVTRLSAIAGVANLTVERDRDLPSEDDTLPLVVVTEGDEAPVPLFLGEDAFDLQVIVEGAATAETVALASSAVATLRAKVEQALMADFTLGGLARDLRPADEDTPQRLDFASEAPTKGFSRAYVITYATREGDPFTFA